MKHEPLVIDIHTHAFPRLGTASGGETAEFHRRCIQHHIQYHYLGFRRASDGTPVHEPLLAPDGDGISYLRDVDLRVGEHGKVEFTVDGEDYFLQWYAPWMTDMTVSPQLMLAFMNQVGVDMVVLQHDHVYGARARTDLFQMHAEFGGRGLDLDGRAVGNHDQVLRKAIDRQAHRLVGRAGRREDRQHQDSRDRVDLHGTGIFRRRRAFVTLDRFAA